MKGIYLLEIIVMKPCRIRIGKLGVLNFEKGRYVYIGSSQTNVEKRIARHYKSHKTKKWHIDYLLANKNVKLERAFSRTGEKQTECKIAYFLSQTEKPVENFGSSDCSCKSHLFRIKTIDIAKIWKKLHKVT